MKKLRPTALAALVVLGPIDHAHAQALGTAFTYQGRLVVSGAPASGAHDFEFRLFDAETGGGPVGGLVALPGVAVSSGLFTAILDFGASAFDGQRRWLEIRVQPAGGGGGFTTLARRQELTASPNALWSVKAGDAQTLGGVAAAGYALTATIIPITQGGTGATTAEGARGNLQTAASGANTDITSLSGLTTPISVAQGGTGASTATAALAALSAQARVAGSCAVGMYVRAVNADGTVVCGTDADTNSGGTVTSVATGAGLSGGPIATAGTVSIATGGVTSNMIANGAVGAAQINTSEVQARVSSTCPSGQYLRGVNADGGAVCEVLNAFPIISTLAATGISFYTSTTIGADGLGLIAYFGDGGGSAEDLIVAHCTNVACSTATTATLVASGSAGRYASITIGADGLGLISHWDTSTGLNVTHCTNTACSSATTTVLDSTGDVGRHTSVTIGTDGLGLISYYDQTNGNLKVAHCANTACSTATTATLDSTGVVGEYTSVTTGADGLGLISYYDRTNGNLKVAHCATATCDDATPVPTTIDSPGDVGQYTSITIGADGLGLISYYDQTNGNLKVAHCADTACSSATTSTRDSIGVVGQYTSVTIGADGLGLITYYDQTNFTLRAAHCVNAACTVSTARTLDDAFDGATSVATGADGFPIITYWGVGAFLKVAKCLTLTCAP